MALALGRGREYLFLGEERRRGHAATAWSKVEEEGETANELEETPETFTIPCEWSENLPHGM